MIALLEFVIIPELVLYVAAFSLVGVAAVSTLCFARSASDETRAHNVAIYRQFRLYALWHFTARVKFD